ncbi:MAG: alpha/beta hydrolase, partial [Roseiflexaceae bacterium]|nr:alpha/beta hydrolase [Roseiflexaceae bacterium]
ELTIHTRISTTLPTGDDRPVFVLIHGLLISSRYMMPTAKRLALYGQVFVPDLPGFGLSENPKHVFTVVELADTLVAWMDVLDLPQAIFIGNSLGCQVLIDLAVRYPMRVRGLILTAPALDPFGGNMVQQFIHLMMDAPLEHFSLALPLFIDIFAGGPYRALLTFRDAMADPVVTKLPQIQAPTLIVRGERDPVVSQRWVEKMNASVPNSCLVIIPGGPHGVNYSTPDALVEIVRAFLVRTQAERWPAPVIANKTD